VSTALFLSDLRRRGIRLSLDGDRLRCSAPSGALTPELTMALQHRKPEVLAFLGAAHSVANQPAIAPLQAHGSKPAVFAVPGHNGDVFTYRELADALGGEQPFFGLQPPGHDEGSAPLERIELLAAYFAEQIVAFRPQGPHIIAGYCAGGCAAFELASQLQERGVEVGGLALFACPPPRAFRWVARMDRRVRVHMRSFAALETLSARGRYIADFARRRTQHVDSLPSTDPVMVRRAALEQITLTAVRRYRPRRFAGRVNFFLPNRAWASAGFQPQRWRRVAADMREYTGPDSCRLDNMLRAPYAALFAGFLANAATGLQPIEETRHES
jgi:thioesterase domain-containing protein